MAIDTDQVRVGVTGSVYVAPLATALPDEPDEALDVAFVDLGATNEDAFEITPSQTIEKIRAWQSSKPVRVVKTEMNADTLPLAFGGGTISATVGLASKFVPPAAGTVDERAFIFEWVDGDYTYRLCVPRGMVSETDSIPVKKDEAISLPLTVEVLGSSPDDFFILTDDPAFA
jgi:hypothetical protein